MQAVEATLENSGAGTHTARELAGQALEANPDYAVVWGILGITYWYEARLGLGGDVDDLIKEAEKRAARGAAPITTTVEAAVLKRR